jgi:hypothetical protein
MGKKSSKKELTKEEKAAKARKRLENYNPVMAARNALRREFSRSPEVIEMMKENTRLVPLYNKDGARAKVDAREHLCAQCKQWKRSSKKSGKVSIDHIEPVVDPNVGFVDMNTYFARMWVAKDKLQKLCGDCHRVKTNLEWFNRRYLEEQEILEKVLKLTIGLVDGYGLSSDNKKLAKKMLQRFTKKKWESGPYPKDFIDKVESLKDSLRKVK